MSISFGICIAPETRQLLVKAIESRIDSLIDSRGSEKLIEKNRFLLDEIKKMQICNE